MTATTTLMPPKTSGDELVDSVHDVMKSMFRRSSPALDAEGISMPQFWAIHMISAVEAAPLSAIARGLGVSAPTVCAKIDELEAAGFVARRRSQKDRRVVEVSLTAKGRRAEARVFSWIGQLMGEAASDLPRHDLETTIRVFRSIHRKLETGAIEPGSRA
jgi:MarR family transcriptional regulator, organic hydroperoxide resistance regulator